MELYRYIFDVKKSEEEHLLVNLQNGVAVLVSDSDYVSLKQGDYCNVKMDSLGLLKEKGFIVSREHNSLNLEYSNIAINLNITNGCNFNCAYCYFKANNRVKDFVSVDEDKLLEWIDVYIMPIHKNIYINYLGGEPLIEYEKILSISRKVKKWVKENGVGYWGEITTNGYYLTVDKAEKLVESGIMSIQITLDGDRIQHNLIRNCGVQNGTYDTILKNVCDCKEIVPIIIRVNINRKTSFKSIQNLLEDLKKRNIGNVYFAVIESNYMSTNDLYAVSYDKAVGIYKKVWLLQKKMGFDFVQKLPPVIGNCIALNPFGFTINYDGKMYVCPSTCGISEFYIDNIYNYNNEEKKISRTIREECFKCTLYPLCMGGCDIVNTIDRNVICHKNYISCMLTNYFKIKYFESVLE